MTKVKFNVSDLDADESTADKQFETPPVGVYPVKIVKCDVETPEGKDQRIHVVVSITKPVKNNYPQMHEYINLVSAAAAFKLDQFLQALGLATKIKRAGEFDTDKLIGKTLQVRVKHESYNGEARARVGAFLAGGKATVGGSKTSTVSETDEGEEIEVELGDLADNGDEDAQARLVDQAEQSGLDPDEYATWAELEVAISEAGEGEEEDAGSSDEDDEEVDFSTLGASADEGDEDAQAQLAGLAAEADVDPDEYATWAEVAEILAEGAGSEESDEEEGEGEDYASMSILDLKKLCKELGIPTGGTKDVLVERLEAYDNEDPFSE